MGIDCGYPPAFVSTLFRDAHACQFASRVVEIPAANGLFRRSAMVRVGKKLIDMIQFTGGSLYDFEYFPCLRIGSKVEGYESEVSAT